MSLREFENDDHAVMYNKYRPNYPAELIAKIISYLKEKDAGPFELLVDVGCGNGQATRQLSKYFNNAYGFDISESQIRQTLLYKNGNIKYHVSPSENLSLIKDESVNLIASATAAHWFNLDLFFKECNRVLKKSGALAIFGFYTPTVGYKDKSDLLKIKVQQLETSLIGKYGSHVLEILKDKYKSVNPPFNDIERYENFMHKCDWSLKDYINYVMTWSPYQRYLAENPGNELLKSFTNEILEIIDEPTELETKIDVNFECFLLLARK